LNTPDGSNTGMPASKVAAIRRGQQKWGDKGSVRHLTVARRR